MNTMIEPIPVHACSECSMPLNTTGRFHDSLVNNDGTTTFIFYLYPSEAELIRKSLAEAEKALRKRSHKAWMAQNVMKVNSLRAVISNLRVLRSGFQQ